MKERERVTQRNIYRECKFVIPCFERSRKMFPTVIYLPNRRQLPHLPVKFVGKKLRGEGIASHSRERFMGL